MTPEESARVVDAVRSEQRRAAAQVESLERTVTAIVESSQLTATDDEHDPEGATIAYERAQAISLLQQARLDLARLGEAQALLESGEPIRCEVCGREIDIERLLALPTTTTCIHCAS
ncbi:MAG: TraR/DksA C4-type zinc finger protein [Actinomycetota bacterium]|nr:TraR/DksA C4-type zinc finger protein [Actinomycetota bacterium]